MPATLTLIDAFAHRAFVGNPAAVCLLDGPRDTAWMQALASELNQSETAFPLARADGDWDLRWFTPTTEVDLCGHATLASAHAIWSGHGTTDALRFHTRSGVLTARRDGPNVWIDLPADPPQALPSAAPLQSALGTTLLWAGRCRFGYFAVLSDAAQVRALVPDMEALAALDAGGVIVTALSDAPTHHFVSRCFAPRAGIPEDPATGAAHCALGPYWSTRLGLTMLRAHQASWRGAELGVEVIGERVHLSGTAVTIFSGSLAV